MKRVKIQLNLNVAERLKKTPTITAGKHGRALHALRQKEKSPLRVDFTSSDSLPPLLRFHEEMFIYRVIFMP
tara:strand:+ start:928 stop:1143 length:216 start_codon:yes stop_codon:yes gene_type:complete